MSDLRTDAPGRPIRHTDPSMEPSRRPRTAPVQESLPGVESPGLDPAIDETSAAELENEFHAPAAEPAPPRTAPAGPPQRPRRRPVAMVRTLPAGHAILVVVGALLFAMLFNSAAMVHAGEGMPDGTTRTLVLGVAKPINSFAHALYLDRPRKWLDSLFGHKPAPTGPSALTQLPPSAADQRPLGSGATAHPARPSAGPSAGSSARASAVPKPRATVAPLRAPTKADPLKLLIAGDSMTEFFGPALVNQSDALGKVAGNTVTKYGTGLVRPDFFDWSLYAQQLVQQQNPEAVVVFMGGNDGQGITLANGQVLPDGSDAWAKEYRRRVEVVMRIFSGNGKRRVYWVPMPIPRSPKLAADYHLMDLAVMDAAASVPGVKAVNIVPRLSVNGQYSDYLPGLNGQTILARARDGIHLSSDGANLAATLVLNVLNKDWHLTDR